MATQQVEVHGSSRRSAGLWLAGVGAGILFSLLFAQARVSADGTWRPQWAAAPWPGSTGAWDIRQEPIVEAVVDVRSQTDATLLQSMGYTCGVGACTVELREGEELALIELGLSVRPMARAIKVSAAAPGTASNPGLGEHSVYGADWSDHGIGDAPFGGGCGYWTLPSLDTSGAPADATISKVVYTVRIAHNKVSDVFAELNHWHGADAKYLTIWNRAGGEVDDGKDDDAANDYDIELLSRETTYFNGRLVNAGWQLAVRDCAWWNTGEVDYWYLYVYYWFCDPPATPTTPYPTNAQTDLARDVDLNWADAAGATSYEVRFGASSPPPVYAQTGSSSYALPQLACGTTYYWQIIAKHSCGSSAAGPVWYFRTIGVPGAATVPNPADGATNQPTSIDLRWVPVAQATSYDVYFGSGLRRPLPFRGNTTYGWSVGDLACGVRYYWKIDSRNECGVTSGSEWDLTTACCTPGTPSAPSPGDGTGSIPLGADLDWADSSGASNYDVYFGAYSPMRPPPWVANVSGSTYDPGALACGTRYAWQIVAKNPCAEKSGPEWDFKTACCPPGTPSGPSPGNGATNQSINVDLGWADAADATSYELFFGTTTSPPSYATTGSSDYALPPLAYGTHYYWKVAAKSACGTTEGPLGDFTTASAPTATPTRTVGPTATRTATVANTPTQTRTTVPTNTPTRTQVATLTGTPAATPTRTQVATLTRTPTATPSGTASRRIYLPVVVK